MAGQFGGTAANVTLRDYAHVGQLVVTAVTFTAGAATAIKEYEFNLLGQLKGVGVDIPTMGATGSTMQWKLIDEFGAVIYESGAISGGVLDFTAIDRVITGKTTMRFSAVEAISTADATCAFEIKFAR